MQSWPNADTLKQWSWKMHPCTFEMLSFLTMKTHHGSFSHDPGMCGSLWFYCSSSLHLHYCSHEVWFRLWYKHEGKAALINLPCSMFQIYHSESKLKVIPSSHQSMLETWAAEVINLLSESIEHPTSMSEN